MINQVFIVTDALKQDDIRKSLKVQQPLVDAGYSHGLVLYIRNGREGVTLDSVVEQQYSNLEKISGQYGDLPIGIMLSNFPIKDLDFLMYPDESIEHVQRGVDFARGLPIGRSKFLTYHLNILRRKEVFEERGEEYWMNQFEKIVRPALEEVARYATDKGVDAMIENYPTPVFGDIVSSDKRTYDSVKLNELRDCYPMTHLWGIKAMQDTGHRVCLDICHARTTYIEAKRGNPNKALYVSDVSKLKDRTLFDDIITLTEADLVHLNDGAGMFSQEPETVFLEGVALGYGDIREMPGIIYYLNSRRIPFVLEVEESDFATRPNTVASIEYILQLG